MGRAIRYGPLAFSACRLAKDRQYNEIVVPTIHNMAEHVTRTWTLVRYLKNRTPFSHSWESGANGVQAPLCHPFRHSPDHRSLPAGEERAHQAANPAARAYEVAAARRPSVQRLRMPTPAECEMAAIRGQLECDVHDLGS
jgi:hypothetical protein